MAVMVIDDCMMSEIAEAAYKAWGKKLPEPHKLARAMCRHCIEALSYFGGMSTAALMESAAEATAAVLDDRELTGGWAHWADAVLLMLVWIWALGRKDKIVVESWDANISRDPIADMALVASKAITEQYGILERELDTKLWVQNALKRLLNEGMPCAAAMVSACNVKWMLLLQCRLKRNAADVFNLNLGGERL